jgi:hypothetical protein
MFRGCTSLKTITLSNNFVTSNPQSPIPM